MLLFITGMISIWLFPNFAIFNWSIFFFNLVLCYLITSGENEEELEESGLKLKEKNLLNIM